MKFIIALALLGTLQSVICEDVRLIDLEPTDAQQILDRQDTSLSYAPKIESNVPAVRYLGADPHHVIEDIYLANQYHGQDGVGGYLYGYKTPDIAKTERKQPQGDLKGAYNYKDNLGHEIKVQYWDDGTGFHQIDNVPKNLPEDAPDVKAEKERFLARWHEEAERNQHPVQDPYERTTGQAQSNYPHQNQNNGQNYYNQQPAASQQTTQYAQQPSLNEIGGSYQQVSYQQPAGGQSGNYGGHATGQATGQGQVGGQQQQYQPVGQQHYQPVGGQQQQQYQPVGQQQYQPVGGQQQQQYQPVGGQQQQYQPAGGQHQVSAYGGQQSQQPVGAVGGQYQGQYEGSSSQQQTSYSQPSYQSGGQGQSKNYYGQGQQNEDEEETTGPPKGFFYNFDYAVPIIVSTGAKAAPGAGLQDIYKSNKVQFESQVQSGSGVASSYSAHQ